MQCWPHSSNAPCARRMTCWHVVALSITKSGIRKLFFLARTGERMVLNQKGESLNGVVFLLGHFETSSRNLQHLNTLIPSPSWIASWNSAHNGLRVSTSSAYDKTVITAPRLDVDSGLMVRSMCFDSTSLTILWNVVGLSFCRHKFLHTHWLWCVINMAHIEILQKSSDDDDVP